MGLLTLIGLISKHGILMVEFANELQERERLDRRAAIMKAAAIRLRPILMTTIALVAGMMPLVLSSGPGAGTNRSIGVLVVGGQSLCLLLTLLAVPVFYSLFDDLAKSRIFSRLFAPVRGVFAWARRKTASATTSFFGLFSKH